MNIYIYIVYYAAFEAFVALLFFLSSATQHAMTPEFGGKQGTECLNIRFSLPTVLCAGYSVKLIFLFLYTSIFISSW